MEAITDIRCKVMKGSHKKTNALDELKKAAKDYARNHCGFKRDESAILLMNAAIRFGNEGEAGC